MLLYAWVIPVPKSQNTPRNKKKLVGPSWPGLARQVQHGHLSTMKDNRQVAIQLPPTARGF